MARVGIIGDMHAPFTHPMYLRFCQDTFAQWNVTKVVSIGDIVDNHAHNFHEHDPDGRSPGDEVVLARKQLRSWKRCFPKLDVCIGNHDELHYRKAKDAGVSTAFIRPYKEVWETPNWNWQFSHQIDGVLYTHGTGNSGKDAAINLAIQKRQSTVIGHVHTYAGVKWHANDTSTIFGLNVGCGIDCRSYAFAYGRDFVVRPMLGCGIVLDGVYAYFEPMRCGPREKYNRSRA